MRELWEIYKVGIALAAILTFGLAGIVYELEMIRSELERWRRGKK